MLGEIVEGSSTLVVLTGEELLHNSGSLGSTARRALESGIRLLLGSALFSVMRKPHAYAHGQGLTAEKNLLPPKAILKEARNQSQEKSQIPGLAATSLNSGSLVRDPLPNFHVIIAPILELVCEISPAGRRGRRT